MADKVQYGIVIDDPLHGLSNLRGELQESQTRPRGLYWDAFAAATARSPTRPRAPSPMRSWRSGPSCATIAPRLRASPSARRAPFRSARRTVPWSSIQKHASDAARAPSPAPTRFPRSTRRPRRRRSATCATSARPWASSPGACCRARAKRASSATSTTRTATCPSTSPRKAPYPSMKEFETGPSVYYVL